MESSVLRLFRFRPTSPSFDAKLRTCVVPHLVGLPGAVAVFAGRAGSDGTRLLASVWTSTGAMDAALGVGGEAGAEPDLFELAVDRETDVLDLAFSLPVSTALASGRPSDIGILRLVRGTTRAGALDAYVSEARDGTLSDLGSGIGPLALYLALDPPDRFVTLSLWDEWAHVEAATGADFSSAERTRHAELLESWSVEHYEVIPGTFTAPQAQAERQPA